MPDAIGIAGTALTVHRKWLDAVADNLANMNTAAATTGDGSPGRCTTASTSSPARHRPRS